MQTPPDENGQANPFPVTLSRRSAARANHGCGRLPARRASPSARWRSRRRTTPRWRRNRPPGISCAKRQPRAWAAGRARPRPRRAMGQIQWRDGPGMYRGRGTAPARRAYRRGPTARTLRRQSRAWSSLRAVGEGAGRRHQAARSDKYCGRAAPVRGRGARDGPRAAGGPAVRHGSLRAHGGGVIPGNLRDSRERSPQERRLRRVFGSPTTRPVQ